ncbi:MAG: metal ABC transporter substrate-binding protein [Thermodesulfovibrionales bacterium]
MVEPFIFIIILSLILVSSVAAENKIKVVVSYPYIESIVNEIGKESVEITSLAKGTEDPHFVVPKPSLIGKLRKADLLIINGASLEIGFIPPLLKQANNPKINPGSEFLIDLSKRVELIDKPENVSRTEGDIHPEGNPHFHLSYNNLPNIAEAIKDALIKVRPDKKEVFVANFNSFINKFNEKKKIWDEKIKSISECKLIQYHRMFNYIAKDMHCKIFAEIEPKPGIPPTAKHIEEITEMVKSEKVYKIITDNYHELKSTKRLSSATGIPYVILPHDVGSIPDAKDIFSMYEVIVERLTK